VSGVKRETRTRSGRPRGGRPQAIGDVLATLLGDLGLAARIEDRRIFAEWEDVVGVSLAREAKPLKVERGILVLGAGHATQANHLLYLKPLILQKIKARYPTSRIRDIRVVLRPAEGWNKG
jgi:predicted nucleic acid-binding Zn ribbon protein